MCIGVKWQCDAGRLGGSEGGAGISRSYRGPGQQTNHRSVQQRGHSEAVALDLPWETHTGLGRFGLQRQSTKLWQGRCGRAWQGPGFRYDQVRQAKRVHKEVQSAETPALLGKQVPNP